MAAVRHLYYFSFPTRIGQLFAAVSNQGVLQLCFERQDALACFKEVARQFGAPIARVEASEANPIGQQLMAEVEEYLAGQRTNFSVPVETVDELSKFSAAVYRHLRTIPYGSTQSYTEVAQAIGHPASARAVGQACAVNRIPLIYPCHRVIRSNGGLGEFNGGVEIKTALLALEKATTP